MLSSLPVWAWEKVPAHWECVLLNDPVDCRELEEAFKNGHRGFRMVSKNEAKLKIRIGKNQLNDSTEYVVRLAVKEKPEQEFRKKLSDDLSSFEKTEKVTGHLTTSLDLVKPELGYIEEPKKENPFYIEPAVSIAGGKQPGSSNINIGGGVEANYTQERYRIVVDGGGVYKREIQEANAFTQKIESNEIRAGVGAGGAYSITNHVSVGAFGGHSRTTTRIETEQALGIPAHAMNHTATRTSARVGVEWIQTPIINDKTNGNFSIRGYVVGEHHNYIDPQTFDLRKETFARPSVDVSYTRQFKTFNLGGTVSGYRSFGRENELQGVRFSGRANFNIKDRVILEPNFAVDYTKNRVRTTAGTNYSFISLTGMQDDDNLTFSYGLSIRVPLGNSRLSRQERRWKD